MMKIARLLITQECHRTCSYCANNYKSIMETATYIPNLSGFDGYDQILITGGEPLLDAEGTITKIKELRHRYPETLIYLYSALYSEKMDRIVKLVDGIHFSLHAVSDTRDIRQFQMFQTMIMDYPEKSFRLYVNSKVTHDLKIHPTAWTRVEIKPWLPEGDCQLPENEKLFILKSRTVLKIGDFIYAPIFSEVEANWERAGWVGQVESFDPENHIILNGAVCSPGDPYWEQERHLDSLPKHIVQPKIRVVAIKRSTQGIRTITKTQYDEYVAKAVAHDRIMRL